MEVEDRKGLLAAVSAKIADINTNIKNMEARTDEDQRARIDMTVEISDLKHLEKVIKSLKGVDGVLGVDARAAAVEQACSGASYSTWRWRRFRPARPSGGAPPARWRARDTAR